MNENVFVFVCVYVGELHILRLTKQRNGKRKFSKTQRQNDGGN